MNQENFTSAATFHRWIGSQDWTGTTSSFVWTKLNSVVPEDKRNELYTDLTVTTAKNEVVCISLSDEDHRVYGYLWKKR